MGIRELAAAAKVAEDAAAAAEQKRLWALNARRGEQTVLSILGVEGKAVRANNGVEKEHGDLTVVKLEDDLYVKVQVRKVYEKNPYSFGGAQVVDEKIGVMLCDEKGNTVMSMYDPVYTLAALGEAMDKQAAYVAAEEARKAKIKAGGLYEATA